jgi:hypothetical protein
MKQNEIKRKSKGNQMTQNMKSNENQMKIGKKLKKIEKN